MITIQDEIEIAAPVAAVWDTLLNFELYAIWNPFIRRVAAPVVAPGEELEVFLQPSGQRGVRIRPYIQRLQPHRELRWSSYILHRALLYGDHTFRLQAQPTNTLFFQRLVLGGILAPLVAAIIESDTLRGIEEMNAALKVHVERYEPAAATSVSSSTSASAPASAANP